MNSCPRAPQMRKQQGQRSCGENGVDSRNSREASVLVWSKQRVGLCQQSLGEYRSE